MPTTTRQPLRRTLASILTAALVASAAALGVAAPAYAVNDALTLSTTTAVTPGADVTVTVTGAGYTADVAPLLPGQSARSVYVGLIEQGTPLDSIEMGGAMPVAAVHPTDAGDLSAELVQTAENLDPAKGYEVIAWPSRSNPSEANLFQRAAVSIDWAALFPPTATVTTLEVSPSEAVEGAPVHLTATVAPAASGTVSFVSAGAEIARAETAEGIATATVTTLPVGSSEITATFEPGSSDYTASTSNAQSVQISAVVPDPEPVADPKVTVTPSAELDPAVANTLTVSGTGFVGDAAASGAYVLFGESSVWSGGSALPSAGWIAQAWVRPAQIVGGAFTVELEIAAGQLTAGGSYQVATSAAHALSATNRSLDTFTPVTVAASAPVFEPAIEVFLADGTTPYTDQTITDGDTLVVKGTGFDPAANVGGMGMPIPATLPQGTFVVFGSFADEWKPSAGAAGTTRSSAAESRRWALAPAVLDQVPPMMQDAIRAQWAPLAEDGSFTAEITVAAPANPVADGNWGVYTYPGGVGTRPNPAQELSVPVSYSADVTPPAPTADPKVTVTPATDLDPAVANTLTVSGTGFVGSAAVNGAYVALGEKGTFTGQGAFPAEGWTALTWVRPAEVAEGRFTTTLTVPAGVLRAGTEYEIVTSAAHGLSATDRTLDTFTAVTVAAPAADGPKVTVTPATDLDPNVENTLTISGTGFTGPAAVNGAYVLFGESSVWSGGEALPAAGWIEQAWVQPREIVGGAFTTEITVPAGTLTAGVAYQVATSAAHGLSVTDRSLDTFTPVTVTEPAVSVPRIFVSPTAVVAGAELEVTGTGFPAGDTVEVSVHSTPVALGSATVAADGKFTVRGSVPADVAAGAHTVVAVSATARAEATLTVTAAAVAPAPETPAAPTCVARAVSGASLEWGVKQSFRDYIGSTAKGEYSIGWGSGSGSFNTDEMRGRVAFGGSASFTGHKGLLDLTISHPRIQVTGAGSASLIVDVRSAGYGSSPGVDASGVVFASLSLPDANRSGSQISWSNAPATLTAAGAAAFAGFYEAGTALDPVSFTVPLGAEVPCDTSTSGALAASGGQSSPDMLWLGLGMLVLGAGLVAARRRFVRA